MVTGLAGWLTGWRCDRAAPGSTQLAAGWQQVPTSQERVSKRDDGDRAGWLGWLPAYPCQIGCLIGKLSAPPVV